MDLLKLFMYVLGWFFLVNSAWVTYQAVFKPDIFYWINNNSESYYLSDESDPLFSRIRAHLHVISGIIGYFLSFLTTFSLAFSFIPSGWGRLNEDAEFIAMSASLAGLASILMTALVWSAIGHAGARSANERAAKEKLNSALAALEEARRDRSHAVFEAENLQEEVKEAKLKAAREKYRHENHIMSLRSLISPEILNEHDRIQREKAATGPRTFYS